ncbi:MAG: hypothetical protein ABSC05_02745 [Candidatus Solibacter sp.]|jgi:hypothetical protein
MKQRPIGLNDKPIPQGMLYSDYTPEQIEVACNAPDFEEKCKHAQDNADRMLELMMKKADKELDKQIASTIASIDTSLASDSVHFPDAVPPKPIQVLTPELEQSIRAKIAGRTKKKSS